MKPSETVDTAAELLAALPPEIKVTIGATLAATMILARIRMPIVPATVFAVMTGVAAGELYLVAEDVHDVALLARQRLTLAGRDEPGLH